MKAYLKLPVSFTVGGKKLEKSLSSVLTTPQRYHIIYTVELRSKRMRLQDSFKHLASKLETLDYVKQHSFQEASCHQLPFER